LGCLSIFLFHAIQHKVKPQGETSAAVPPTGYKEQQIASVLTTADKKLKSLQQRPDCLKQEKKALMQQLLTGRRRVREDVDVDS